MTAISVLFFCSPALGAEIEAVHTQGGISTAGVIVELGGADGNESVRVEVSREGAPFEDSHDAVEYQPGVFAAPIFDLHPGIDVRARITLDDPDGVTGTNPIERDFDTRHSSAVPPRGELWVAPDGRDAPDAGSEADPFKSIQYAIDAAEPGNYIRVQPGTYEPISISDRRMADDRPLVISATDFTNRPVIATTDNTSGQAISIERSSNIWILGVIVRDDGTHGDEGISEIGVRFHSSRRLALQDSYIHDCGHYNVLITKSDQYPEGATAGGYHLIEGNVIADEDHDSCSRPSNEPCPRQTVYGIKMDNNPGAGTVIKNNEIFGHVDNIAVGGDEGAARNLPFDSNVLALTGGEWTNHDLEVFRNVIYDARDDNIEMDGISVNARVVENTLGDAENPISVAPVMPGPTWFVRNIVAGSWGQAAFKLNTSGTSDIPTRNVYVYHNNFARLDEGTVLNLWYGLEGAHNVPISNVVFRNNVFWTRSGGRLIDTNAGDGEHPSFDYNMWYTTDTSGIFTWPGSPNRQVFDDFSSFRSATGQATNGHFGDPLIATDTWYPMPDSLVIDEGVYIAGINDDYSGSAPDMGAVERLPQGGADGGWVDADNGDNRDVGTGDTGQTGSDASGGGDASDTSGGGDSGGGDNGGDGTGSGDNGCDCTTTSSEGIPAGTLLFGVFVALAVVRRR